MALPDGWQRHPQGGLIINGAWVPDFTNGDKVNWTGLQAYLCNKRTQLYTGPRFSTKSLSVCNRLAKHGVMDVPNARILMFAKTMKTAIRGGIWSDLTENIIPRWIDAGVGVKYKVEPKVDGATRMHYCSITNPHGFVSEYQMSSLEYCPDIEQILKSKRFSCIYFSELDTFDDAIVFQISQGQLRHMLPNGKDLPYDRHLWISDTNPAEEGEDSWIYKKFWIDRLAETPPKGVVAPEDIAAWQLQKENMAVHEFTLDDNVWWDEPRKRAEVSPFIGTSLYDRYVKGSWKASSEKALFGQVFKPEIHIIGEPPASGGDHQYLLPTDDCVELVTGWDLGTSINHSAHICQVYRPDLFEKPQFWYLDELVSTGRQLTLEEFTGGFIELMDFWEDYFKRKHNRQIRWMHWSDNSAFVFRSASKRAEAADHLIVRNSSAGRIILRAAPKFAGSVKQRLNMMANALAEDRMFLSTKCPRLIEAVKLARRGDTKAEPIVKDRHTHSIDSASYIIIAETADAVSGGQAPRSGSSLVTL